MPVPASTVSASGNDVAIANPMPPVSPSEFTSVKRNLGGVLLQTTLGHYVVVVVHGTGQGLE